MDDESDLIPVAYKLLNELGSEACPKVRAIVAAHVSAEEEEGAVFWGRVAKLLEQLQQLATVAQTLELKK